MRLGAALWRTNGPALFAIMSAGALTVVFLIALYTLILRPTPPRHTEVIPAENAKYWHLPTGLTISYQEFLPPSDIAVKPDPIVFLHGGPGLRFAPFDSDIYGKFTADGFRVYLFDQAGSGASAFLTHIREYTIIRNQLHAERMILIGHSWGSTLAASYIAKYPSQTDNPGLNPYVMEGLIGQTSDSRADPHTALQGNKTAAILLVGECNYIPWRAALDNRRTFANLKIFYFPNAGHYIQFEQPELMTKVIRHFLLDQPDAIPPYSADSDPSPLPK
jgi:pimeloyl-ACP methyl ester carboxylesterase